MAGSCEDGNESSVSVKCVEGLLHSFIHIPRVFTRLQNHMSKEIVNTHYNKSHM